MGLSPVCLSTQPLSAKFSVSVFSIHTRSHIFKMRRLFLLATVLSLINAQSTDSPNKRCKCEIGTKEDHHDEGEFTALFVFHNAWEQDCDFQAAEICQEECLTERDLLQLFGGWSVIVPENNNNNNSTVGEIACNSLGRDETHGVVTELYSAVCEVPFTRAGHGIHEPLCCVDGRQVECRHQP